MRKRSLIGAATVLLPLLAALPAHAGVVIVDETTPKGARASAGKVISTVTIEGNRQRLEQGGRVRIVDLDSGRVLTLTLASKTYDETTVKKESRDLVGSMLRDAGDAKFRAKGTHQTIAGRACDDYSGEMQEPKLQWDLCVATSGPGVAEHVAFLKRMMAAYGAKDVAPAGIPLLQDTPHDRTVVTSITTPAVPASAFELPAGYTREAPPAM